MNSEDNLEKKYDDNKAYEIYAKIQKDIHREKKKKIK